MPNVNYSYLISTQTATGVVSLERLGNEILTSALGSLYVHSSIPIEDTLHVVFTTGLDTAQESTLDGLIAAHTGHPTPQESVDKAIGNAVAFGSLIMQDFATENVLSGYNTVQVKAIADHLTSVQRYLQSGSLYVTMYELQNTSPLSLDGVELVSQARIDLFISKISTYLGL